jgi:glycosyltransferase involved in cell wall biosynthesis
MGTMIQSAEVPTTSGGRLEALEVARRPWSSGPARLHTVDRTPGPTISLVIPAYNEAHRLPATLGALATFLAARPSLQVEILVVDNASTDRTSAVVRDAMEAMPGLRLIRLERRGKGCAVRAGVLAARGRVVVFADADLSWPLPAPERFADLIDDDVAVVIGSREGIAAQRVGEPPYRHVMGRAFNRLVQSLVVPGIEDTQCGLKAFRADAADAIFRRQRLDGFAFDVEVLYLARSLGYRIADVPIRWEHKLESRVRPVRDALAMLRDVLVVRLTMLCGGYRMARACPEADRAAMSV